MSPFLLLLPLAHAYVYFTKEQIEREFFPDADVREVRWTPDAEALAALRAALGYAPPAHAYTLLVGPEGTGVGVLDEQLGQHEPISIATLIDAAYTVRRVEVMVYREAYGDGVRAPGFRTQFVGRGPDDPMRAGREIRIVSGATISSRALATAVRRACALVRAWAA